MFTDFQNMLQTVNVGGFAWTDLLGQIFKGKLDLSKASSILMPTTGLTFPSAAWTPTDASGASLSFSSVSANYIKVGKLVCFTATLTYPITVNGSQAKIGGLPFTVGFDTTTEIFDGSATDTRTFLRNATTNIELFIQGSFGGKTNAQMSAVTVVVSGCYQSAT